MVKTGLYIIKDQFFKDMNEPYLKGNKEQNRPHYYCFKDTDEGIYWMIPMSSKIEKFQKIVDAKLIQGKSCDVIHIAKLDNDKKSAFLIADMFPITEKYVEREYTIAGNPMRVTSEHEAKAIEQKARKVLGMIKRGVKFTPTQINLEKILYKLKQDQKI